MVPFWSALMQACSDADNPEASAWLDWISQEKACLASPEEYLVRPETNPLFNLRIACCIPVRFLFPDRDGIGFLRARARECLRTYVRIMLPSPSPPTFGMKSCSLVPEAGRPAGNAALRIADHRIVKWHRGQREF